MSRPFRNEIDIMVWLTGTTISDVAIRPRSRPPLTRLFAGKPASALIPVLPRLFSLCSVAHQVAFLSAIEAAQGLETIKPIAMHRLTAVVAERLTELIRGLFVAGLELDQESAPAVRSMIQASTTLSGAVETVPDTVRRDVIAHVKAALRALGVSGEHQPPAPGSVLSTYLTRCDREVMSLPAADQFFLTPADDLEIVTRLMAEGTAYSEAPELCGKVPETGVWARRAQREQILSLSASGAARVRARIDEIARLTCWLDARRDAPDNGVVASYRLGERRGAAAVECARGRLHHAVKLDEEGRIVGFEYIAPTEWNFHERGPLVRSLKGALLSAGRQGQDAVRTLVGAFDPCVGFSVSFREASHA
ncbi:MULTISPECIES: nickel-dependent hydrogenase large subunit [Bradyrhizobium]|uniref:Hydrogenase assembly protein HupF n=4 Tax=Bradyrhizobium TaxID=374 RepID=A0AAE5X9A6_9BRAD|nr:MULTISPECIES: nickel-dependent hydrogenase large subunit [Bradyrhizobium]MCG2628039.1 nickel-dependent hydrogenase large subunit [Bradyrhizobium zhengyangense]MCG2643158.1 nickel-dependent hydrogenase large subunit [Bradyrhizobium zhengyangense]MDN4985737.1 nickel-dependent hydrogenase large subunit [Bradyrhizobium sp. WYCCWR 13022]MDT4736578.1 nickel-dependent hydrogenase large subunit [Bradyrhizobium sp. WYCCWR 12699]QAU43572.1 hypothetical protein X265_38795 [Bradyrhizobium guangdongense